jgi:hypothetical protein
MRWRNDRRQVVGIRTWNGCRRDPGLSCAEPSGGSINRRPRLRRNVHVHDRAVDDHDHVHVHVYAGDRWRSSGGRGSCPDRDRSSLESGSRGRHRGSQAIPSRRWLHELRMRRMTSSCRGRRFRSSARRICWTRRSRILGMSRSVTGRSAPQTTPHTSFATYRGSATAAARCRCGVREGVEDSDLELSGGTATA